MSVTKTLTVADVTRAPAMRPAETEDGVRTGMWVTGADSVALADDGRAVR